MTNLFRADGEPTCGVCGEKPHVEPFAFKWGLFCPGENASDEAKADFYAERAWRTEFAAKFGDDAAKLISKEAAEALLADNAGIVARQEAISWAETHRMAEGDDFDPSKNPYRSKATHEDLVAHANSITPGIVAKVNANERREEIDPQIYFDPPNLTVRGKVPERKEQLITGTKVTLDEIREKGYDRPVNPGELPAELRGRDTDALMFTDSPDLPSTDVNY